MKFNRKKNQSVNKNDQIFQENLHLKKRYELNCGHNFWFQHVHQLDEFCSITQFNQLSKHDELHWITANGDSMKFFDYSRKKKPTMNWNYELKLSISTYSSIETNVLVTDSSVTDTVGVRNHAQIHISKCIQIIFNLLCSDSITSWIWCDFPFKHYYFDSFQFMNWFFVSQQ